MDTRKLIRQIVQDAESGVSAGAISARFHNTLVAWPADVYRPIRAERGLKCVPANDGGIALGQVAIACELVRREA